MVEEKPLKIPIISVSQTAGLTSIQQLIDTTPNEIFSFKDTTSKIEGTPIVFLPSYEKIALKPEKSREDPLKEFKSIVKNKLKKPIDLKRLYYEQMEHDIL